jgi:hypothetical protein
MLGPNADNVERPLLPSWGVLGGPESHAAPPGSRSDAFVVDFDDLQRELNLG